MVSVWGGLNDVRWSLIGMVSECMGWLVYGDDK